MLEAPTPELIARLVDIVGPRHAITDPSAQAPFLKEWRDTWTGRTPVVLQPGSTSEVRRILALCHEARVGVVPQSGNTGLVGGQIPMAFAAPGTARPHITTGKLRPLAVTGPRRLKDMPDVPTFVESGITGVDATLIVGFLAPSKTPSAIVRRLHDTLANVVTSPEVSERMNGLSLDLIVADPERSAAILKDELALWTRVVRSTGAKAE